MQEVDAGTIQANGSNLILTEVLVHPIQNENTILARQYQNILRYSHNFQLLPVPQEVVIKGAAIRARYRLKTPDALHVATAIVNKVDAFLTNDARIKRVTEIPIWVLDEMTTA